MPCTISGRGAMPVRSGGQGPLPSITSGPKCPPGAQRQPRPASSTISGCGACPVRGGSQGPRRPPPRSCGACPGWQGVSRCAPSRSSRACPCRAPPLAVVPAPVRGACQGPRRAPLGAVVAASARRAPPRGGGTRPMRGACQGPCRAPPRALVPARCSTAATTHAEHYLRSGCPPVERRWPGPKPSGATAEPPKPESPARPVRNGSHGLRQAHHTSGA
jgi:hypothetical protein